MKKTIIIACISLTIAQLSFSQSKQTKAFSNSYEHEYNKEYGLAIASLDSIYNANSYEINLRLGWLYYMKQDYLKSVKFYKNAMHLKPTSIEAMFGYVYPLAAMDNWDEVIQVYKDILVIDPQNYTANIRMANIFYFRKDFNRAITYAKVNGASYPFDYYTNLVLGQISIGMGKIDEAKKHLSTALLYYPESKDATALLKGL